jgi:hypothetical protein
MRRRRSHVRRRASLWHGGRAAATSSIDHDQRRVRAHGARVRSSTPYVRAMASLNAEGGGGQGTLTQRGGGAGARHTQWIELQREGADPEDEVRWRRSGS